MTENRTDKAEKRWLLKLTLSCDDGWITLDGAYVTAADTPEGWAKIRDRADWLIDDAHELAKAHIAELYGYSTDELTLMPYGSVLSYGQLDHDFDIDTPDRRDIAGQFNVTVAIEDAE